MARSFAFAKDVTLFSARCIFLLSTWTELFLYFSIYEFHPLWRSQGSIFIKLIVSEYLCVFDCIFSTILLFHSIIWFNTPAHFFTQGTVHGMPEQPGINRATARAIST